VIVGVVLGALIGVYGVLRKWTLWDVLMVCAFVVVAVEVL
jgi:hypothetical protein